jgi:hypothetical protein
VVRDELGGKSLAGKNRRTSLLSRLGLVGAATAAAVVALVVASQAWANSTININPGNVPTTAAGFPTHICSANQGGGPYPDQDVWVFVLPGNHSESGDFVSVTADFGTNGTKTITAATQPGNFANGGPAAAKAWIVTDAGWTLTGATAVITGTAEFFVLSHTCPASGTPGPSPSPSPSPSSSRSPTPAPSVPTSPPGSTPPSGPSSPATPGGPGGTTPHGGANTGGGGSQQSGSLAWGLAALAVASGGAAALVLAWRRRNDA